jgi:predicted esterase
MKKKLLVLHYPLILKKVWLCISKFMFKKPTSKLKKWLLLVGVILLTLIIIPVLFSCAYVLGWIGIPAHGGWICHDTFSLNGKKHPYMAHIPYGVSTKSTILVTIAHPKDCRIIEQMPMRSLLAEYIHYERISHISKLATSQKPIIVRYFHYWNEEKDGKKWLKASNQDSDSMKHVFDASENFQAFISEINRKYKPSNIFAYGYSFEGTALLALAEQNPEYFSGIAALASPTVSMALPQIKNDLAKIAHLALYFAWGENDKVLGGKTTMLEHELPFKEELQKVGQNYRYVTIPNANHSNIPFEEKKKAIDWIFKQKNIIKP